MRPLPLILAATAALMTGCQPANKVKSTLALSEIQNQAGYAESQGDDAKAIALWNEYIERRPHEAMARHRLGLALMRTGDPKTAADHFWVAHDLKPSRLDYLESLVDALEQAGEQETAFQVLRDTIDEGGLAAGHLRLAKHAIRAGLIDEAEESIRIAAAVEGTKSDAAYRMMAQLARQTGDQEREITALRTILWFNSSDAETNARLRELGVIPGPSIVLSPVTGG
jgi:tetratricopeptide (TPR) repeat protein